MKSKYKLIFFMAIILIFIFSAYSYSYNTRIKDYSIGPNLTASDRVLIFAPHPDDESLSSAGLIGYCVQHNIPVHVVVVTNGGQGKLSQIRHFETLNATAKLGLPSQDITFLDYPQVIDRLFNENWDPKNFYSDDTNHNPFAYQRNSTYCGDSLETNIESVIQNFTPTIIIYPSAEDDNTDHWGTSAFVDYSVTKMDYPVRMYNYLVHNDVTLWPFPRSYFPQSNLLPPAYLANQTNWIIFPMNSTLEQSKYDAVNSYQSQMKKDPIFLRSYVRKNELFAVDNDINITRHDLSTDYTNSDSFPGTVFHDPAEDILNHEHNALYSILTNENKYDINNIGFEIDNNITWISVTTTGGISKNGIYQFHIIGFGDDDGVSRIDFEMINGKPNYYMPSKNGISPHLIVRSNDKGIVVGIPDMFAYNKFMVDVESSNGTKYLDRTGYFNVNVS